MAWRIQITSDSYYTADYVFALGYVGITSFLELWLGFLVACIPTLAPLAKRYISPVLSKYYGRSKHNPGGIQLREAQNTIGGGSKPKGARRHYGKLEEGTSHDLLESKHVNSSRVTGGPTASQSGTEEEWMPESGAIGVTHDFDVQFERPEQAGPL